MLSGVTSKKISCIEPPSSSHTKWQAAGSLPHGCVRVSYVRFRQGTERTRLQGGWARSRLGLPIASRRNRVVGALRSANRELLDSLASQLKTPRDFWFAFHCLTNRRLICPASPTCTRRLSYQYFATALVSGTLSRRGYVTNWNVSRDLPLAWRQEVGRKVRLPCAQGWYGVSFPRGGKARS